MFRSQNMERKLPVFADIIYPVPSFAGGMNSRASELFLSRDHKLALREDQATLLNNFVRTSTGNLQSRWGRVKVNTSAVVPPAGDAVIRSLFELRTQSGTNRILMNAGNSVYYLNGTTWTSLGTVATNNLRMHWTQFNDTAIGINGTDTPVYVDGTPSFGTVSGSPPSNGAAIASHRNRVWIVAGRTLHYCALGAFNDWTTPNNAGKLPIPTTRGKGGTALFSLWDRLIVFTSDQVFQVIGSGPGNFALEPINLSYGNELSPYGVLTAGNDIYYGSQRGCHSLGVSFSQSVTGDVSYDYISGSVEPTWQDITPANLANVVGIHDSQKNLLIYLCNRNGTNNNEALVADYYHLDANGKPTWSMYANMPFASGAEVYSINNTREVIFGGYDGYVYRQADVNTDDGANLDLQVTYITDLGTPEFSKLWRYLLVFTNGQAAANFNGTFTLDFGADVKNFVLPVVQAAGGVLGSTFMIGSSVLGTGGYKQTRVGIAGHGRFGSLNLSASVNTRITLGGLIFYAGIRRAIHH
jgi:hypothetical protein